jgi:replication factor C subunit 2/4
MRQAINNLQSTFSGFGFVSGDNVFKICDQPHPIVVKAALRSCLKGDVDEALEKIKELWGQGYSAVDIVVTLFRVVKTFDEYVLFLNVSRTLDGRCYRIPEYTKLEFIKVGGVDGYRLTIDFAFAGNWVYTYADFGGCGDTCSASGSGGKIVQDGALISDS